MAPKTEPQNGSQLRQGKCRGYIVGQTNYRHHRRLPGAKLPPLPEFWSAKIDDPEITWVNKPDDPLVSFGKNRNHDCSNHYLRTYARRRQWQDISPFTAET